MYFTFYQWLDCNNNFEPISGATAQNYTAIDNGNYAVVVNENGCIDTSACTAILISSPSRRALTFAVCCFAVSPGRTLPQRWPRQTLEIADC